MKARIFAIRAAVWVAFCLLALPAWSAAQRTRTDKGVVTGAVQGNTYAFLGIPYAAPPVGPLRFRPPQPHDVWKHELAATTLPAFCPQPSGGNEDCLYLNVWTPKQLHTGLPVLVFFHGGAFQLSGSAFPYFNGAALAQTGDVVVVTVNYRLGALGFLTAAALDAESPQHVSGNYGLMDQQAALKWVHTNIPAFGGDADNVAIFGQSAGADSVLYHLDSPQSAHLFARAIAESPVDNAQLQTLADAEHGSGAAIVTKLNCATATDIPACLRAVPAAQLVAAGSDARPVLDNVVLPRQPIDAFRTGKFNLVPVIIGSTHDEWTAFVWHLVAPPNQPMTEQGYADHITAAYHDNAAAVLKEYPVSAYPSPIQAFATVQTDSQVACPVAEARDALSRHVLTYGYELNEPDPARAQLLGPPLPGLNYGDYHTADLPYVFGVSAPDGTPVAGKDATLSHKVMGYWSDLARSGNPNRPPFKDAGPAWPIFTQTHIILSFQDGIATMTDARFREEHHCGFWNQGA
jgi:para-nitrobenzyl esterase